MFQKFRALVKLFDALTMFISHPTESMISSQMQAVSQPTYGAYSSADYGDIKPMGTQFNSPHYMAPYPTHNRLSIHDRRQSMMTGNVKVPNTPSSSSEVRSRQDYPVTLADDVSGVVSAAPPHASAGSWDPVQQLAQPLKQEPLQDRGLEYSAVQPNLPPLSEALVASPPNFYSPNPYMDMQAPVSVYPPQSQFESDTKVTSHSRRVSTYPYVPTLEAGSGLVMPGVMPAEPAGSPLSTTGPFTQGGIVGASPVSVPVPGMPRASPGMDYVDSLALKQDTQAAGMHPGWPQSADVNGSKVYSFVPLSGVNSKKRPRRRFDEIERLYVCNWGDCEKAYGTLNHLNAHVSMQKHGPKRLPAEFKELRKAWRKHKRAEEEAAKQAAAFHQQQQSQQAQLQPPLCDPVLAHMHPVHHPLAMHAMTHHQPHQLPHPHAHPNQHAHPHMHHAQSQQHHHHPMGF
ncbi:hypothetical protein BGX34_003314 [Mortierella sp. NVP85]|nr:hypothetical protein BGX34_003314 [Mortierella sp. NVP85]